MSPQKARRPLYVYLLLLQAAVSKSKTTMPLSWRVNSSASATPAQKPKPALMAALRLENM